MSYQLLMQHFKNPAGLAAALAPFGTITQQAIYKWRASGIPIDRAPLIEVASDGCVKCDDLRPDVEWIRDESGNVTGYNVPVALVETPKTTAA